MLVTELHRYVAKLKYLLHNNRSVFSLVPPSIQYLHLLNIREEIPATKARTHQSSVECRNAERCVMRVLHLHSIRCRSARPFREEGVERRQERGRIQERVGGQVHMSCIQPHVPGGGAVFPSTGARGPAGPLNLPSVGFPQQTACT